jgi:hypothetical protein
MHVIRKSPGTDDLFDVVTVHGRNEFVVALKVTLETALASCKHLEVTLQASACEYLIDQLSLLRGYEAENYNQQITDMYRDLPEEP